MSQKFSAGERRLWRRARLGGASHGQVVCPEPNLLAAYADGTVSPEQRESLEAHLFDCSDCREAVAAVRRPEPTSVLIPASLVRRALELVPDGGAQVEAPVRFVFVPAAGWAAAAAVALLTAYLAFQLGHQTSLLVDRAEQIWLEQEGPSTGTFATELDLTGGNR